MTVLPLPTTPPWLLSPLVLFSVVIQVTAATNTDSITVGDFVQECDAAGSLVGADGEGQVIAKDGDVYTILVTAGSFALGTALTADGGSTFTAVSTASDALGTLTAYSRDGGYKLSAFFAPASHTVAEGEDYGWTLTPKASEKVTSGGPADATAYVYNAEPRNCGLPLLPLPLTTSYPTAPTSTTSTRLLSPGMTLRVPSLVSKYRFAGRPGTSQNARERGASNDELNIIVYDATGNLTGSTGQRT